LIRKALVEAQQEGKVRSLGVSNYGVHHLDELEEQIKELEAEGKGKGGVISVGQWEIHPWLPRDDIVSWCQKRGIAVEAYSPLVRGERLEEKVLQPLTKKYGKTAAQVLLRWSLQKGLVPLPKSVTPKRIEENADIYDFELTAEEMKTLETGEYSPVCWDPTISPLEQ
jgi:diketogulonate reductase-like aldo/keto reductase